MNRRTTGIAAAAVVVLALVVTEALALGGGDDEPRDAVSETGTKAAGGTTAAGETSPGKSEPEPQAESDPGDETAPEPAPEAEPAPEPDPAPAPAPEPARYAPYSGSGGEWQTLVPSGAGWRKPVEAERVPGRRYRTTIRGPRGAVLLIDHSPLAAVGFGSEYGSKRELTHPWFGSMTEYRLGDGSVGYVLNASEGGPGFRVFASEPTRPWGAGSPTSWPTRISELRLLGHRPDAEHEQRHAHEPGDRSDRHPARTAGDRLPVAIPALRSYVELLGLRAWTCSTSSGVSSPSDPIRACAAASSSAPGG